MTFSFVTLSEAKGLKILRFVQNDLYICHPERSEGSEDSSLRSE